MAPLDRANVDTDAIIPKQFLKSIKRSGFGQNLFDEWRYLDHGEPGMDPTQRKPNPDFVLNLPRYRGAQILLARSNFGCGSSREHAVWALKEYGFRAIIASSFNPIFRGNCVRNGIIPIELDSHAVVAAQQPLSVDLPAQTVRAASGEVWHFELDDESKSMLALGLDAIDLTLLRQRDIEEFRAQDSKKRPWAYLEAS